MTLATAGISSLFGDGYKVNFASGTYTGDGSATASLKIGFTPKIVKIFDMTNGKSWEWVDGMPATDSIYHTSGADIAIDTNTVIVTNRKVTTVTGVGVYDPAQGGANDGVLINTSLSVWAPDPTITSYVCQLSTNVLVNATAYVWYAIG